MRRTIVALLLGEAILLTGLALAWLPLALVVAGGQLTAVALLAEDRKAKQ